MDVMEQPMTQRHVSIYLIRYLTSVIAERKKLWAIPAMEMTARWGGGTFRMILDDYNCVLR